MYTVPASKYCQLIVDNQCFNDYLSYVILAFLLWSVELAHLYQSKQRREDTVRQNLQQLSYLFCANCERTQVASGADRTTK